MYIKLTISCHGGTYPEEPLLVGEQQHSGGIKSHRCWWEIWHWLWCLLFPDLYENRAVNQISVQGLGFLSSSQQRHVPRSSKLKKKTSPQLILFFICNLSLLSLPQFLYSQCKKKDSTSYMYKEAQGNVKWHENRQPSTILAKPWYLC